jgi:hypothetical protein
MIGIYFDVYSLQSSGTYGVHTTSTDIYSAPRLTTQDEKLAQADGSVIVKATLEPKVFSCDGYMIEADISALDTLLDEFKQALNKQNQNFDIDYAGSTRRYVATPRNIMISRDKGLNSAGWSVEFFCANPVGAEISTSALLAATVNTSSSLVSTITVNGSYVAEPLITVTLTAVTGGTTNKTITISNDTTLRGISITRDWSATDVLEIDCLNKTLYVNDTVVAYSGQFPKWTPGNGAISYLDDFTTRTVSIEATYTKRYL